MKFRLWISILTAIFLVIAVYLGREQVFKAWGFLGGANIYIFLLLAPVQFLSYYANGEIMFSYLKSKGDLKSTSKIKMARIALELNFVNHIIPIPSIAGFSYLSLVLKNDGVSVGRSTMAQIIRYVLTFVSFVTMIFISVIILSFDGGVNRSAIIISLSFVAAVIVITGSLIYIIGNKKRLTKISKWLTSGTNSTVRRLTFGKKNSLLGPKKLEHFLFELHDDYIEIKRDKKLLIKPMAWAIINNIFDVSLILVAFIALGFWVNPAALFVAYGIASFVAIFTVTPGGSGAYEAVMIAFLASTGVPLEVAIAGTLLARATLFTSTIVFGYIFYQLTINKYGKNKKLTSL